jgi:hypothetical protein
MFFFNIKNELKLYDVMQKLQLNADKEKHKYAMLKKHAEEKMDS